MIGYFEQGEGIKSMMRLLAFASMCIGGATVIAAIVFGIFASTRQLSGTFIIAGPALIGAGSWAKSVQARGEK